MARGGKRTGAGRPKGSLSATRKAARATIEELARAHTDTALNTLVSVATEGESEAARVAASTALLDRGYGKPHQSQTVTMGASEAFIHMLKAVHGHRAQMGTVANGVDQSPERPAKVRH